MARRAPTPRWALLLMMTLTMALAPPRVRADDNWVSRVLERLAAEGRRRLVNARENSRIARLEGASGTAASFSGDGKYVLTAGADKARVWDARTFKPVTGPLEHGPVLTTAALSPDGARVLTAAGDEVRLWDATTGAPLLRLKHGGTLRSACFSPDGRKVLTAGDDRFTRLWDVQTGKQLLARKHPAAVYQAEFSADGTRVLSVARLGPGDKPNLQPNPEFPAWAGAYGVAYVWAADTARDVTEPRPLAVSDIYHRDEPWLRPAALSPDGTRFATSSPAFGTALWDDHTSTALAGVPAFDETVLPGTGSVAQIVFAPDGRRFLTTAPDHDAMLWNGETGAWRPLGEAGLFSFSGYESAAFSRDGARVLLTHGAAAAVADAASGAQLLLVERNAGAPAEAPAAAAFSPDGRRVAAGFAGDGYTGVYDVPEAEK